MLQIATALTAVSPLLLENRLMLSIRFWVASLFCLLLGFGVAAITYITTILGLVEVSPPGQTLSPIIYSLGFALATLLAVIAGSLLSPARLVPTITIGTCAVAMLFPIGLYVHFGLAGTWCPTYLLYWAGSVGGVYGIACPASWVRAIMRLDDIRVSIMAKFGGERQLA